MDSILYCRIKELCDRQGISVSKLECDCGFSNSTIKKWEKTSVPGADKVVIVAKYFGVSTDYLLGVSDIPDTAEKILTDDGIIFLQKEKLGMPLEDQDRISQMAQLLMQLLRSKREK